MRNVVVVQTGVANTASVLAGLERAGCRGRLTHDRREVEDAEELVLPGVGTFAATMDTLRALDLADLLRTRIAEGRRTLAICVGLQVLFEASEESHGVRGLGVFPGTVGRFPSSLRVPQLGWNQVQPSAGSRFIAPGYAYFANSYRVTDAPDGAVCARAEHGSEFIAAIEAPGLLACQFHPELSSTYGAELLKRWFSTEDTCLLEE